MTSSVSCFRIFLQPAGHSRPTSGNDPWRTLRMAIPDGRTAMTGNAQVRTSSRPPRHDRSAPKPHRRGRPGGGGLRRPSRRRFWPHSGWLATARRVAMALQSRVSPRRAAHRLAGSRARPGAKANEGPSLHQETGCRNVDGSCQGARARIPLTPDKAGTAA